MESLGYHRSVQTVASSEDLLSGGDCSRIQHQHTIQTPLWIEGKLTISTDVIRLDVHALDLATLDDDSVALATVGTEEGGSRELNV